MRIGLWCLGLALVATPQARREDRCAVEGSVLNAKTKEPLDKALIRLLAMSGTARAPLTAVTEPAGLPGAGACCASELAPYSLTSVTLANPSSTVGGRSLAAMRSSTSSGTVRGRPRLRSKQTASGTSKNTASTFAP